MDVAAESLNQLSASEAAHRIAMGEITAQAMARACLARIEAREGAVHAWAFLDPEQVLVQARACDREDPRGALHGVPVGVKNIIDTADMPTRMGSPIYDGYRPVADASCVAILRAAGAVIMGKTITAEFAGTAPGATANPHDPVRTPGGSSSGSAAAVADFMIPAAFGTQTGGSVLRPSSYCGVIGFKPTFGTFNLFGVKPAAQSLDTLGLHTRTLDDIALLTDVLVGRTPRSVSASMPHVGLCRTYLWDHAQPETKSAVEDAAKRLADAGAAVLDIALAEPFTDLTAARETINAYERARVMAHEWAHDRDRLSDQMQRTISRGLETSFDNYAAALQTAEECRVAAKALFAESDVLLAPAVDGEAPEGLGDTGSPRFQGLWTLLHLPTLTLPTHRGPNGLPVGIQLVGRYRGDDDFLSAASWVSQTLGNGHVD